MPPASRPPPPRPAGLLLLLWALPLVAAADGNATTQAEAPAFSPTTLVHTTSVDVDIACPSAAAQPHFTTDGSAPTASSLSWTHTLTWDAVGNTTFRAVCVQDGLETSAVVDQLYTVRERAGTPTFSPASGASFVGAANVTLSSSSGAAVRVHYTLDGLSTPTAASPWVPSGGWVAWDSPGTAVLRAVSVGAGLGDSNVAQAVYDVEEQAAAPVFSPTAETHTLSVDVEISSATDSATVYYTTDGSTPSAALGLPLASGAVLSWDVVGWTTFSAVAVADGMADSAVVRQSYWVQERTATPAISPAAGEAEPYVRGVSLALDCADADAVVYYTTSAADTPDAASSPSVAAGETIRVDAVGTSLVRAVAVAPDKAESYVAELEVAVVLPEYEEAEARAGGAAAAAPDVAVAVINQKLASGYHRRATGHLVTLANPVDHFSVLEPLDGCDAGTALPSDTARAFRPEPVEVEALPADYLDDDPDSWATGCEVVANGGFFNTTSGGCLGSIVSQGRVVRTAPEHNVKFGLRGGRFVTGYIPQEEVRNETDPFEELITGTIWLVRNGESYVDESLEVEDMSLQTTGSTFVTVHSARTAIGHDAEGRLMLLQVEGETWSYGVDLYEMAGLLIELGAVNAINLDGGGSASVTQNDSLVSSPSWRCNQSEPDSMLKCEKPVTSTICVHRALYTLPGSSSVSSLSGSASLSGSGSGSGSASGSGSTAVDPPPGDDDDDDDDDYDDDIWRTDDDSASAADGGNSETEVVLPCDKADSYRAATITLAVALAGSAALHVYQWWLRGAPGIPGSPRRGAYRYAKVVSQTPHGGGEVEMAVNPFLSGDGEVNDLDLGLEDEDV